MSDILVKHVSQHFYVSFEMLKNHIDNCPDNVWNKKHGGYIFWQQLLHAFEGVLYWMRNSAYDSSLINPLYHADLENTSELCISKNELNIIVKSIEKQVSNFLKDVNDEWLSKQSYVKEEMLNIDVIINQMRHIQYHVGHCNCILRELNVNAVNWIGYLENTEES